MSRYIIVIPLFLIGCTSATEKNSFSETCSLKPETGHCRAAIPKYFFDKEQQRCSQFTWGGCGGVVPFETEKECKNLCSSNTDASHLTKLSKSLSQWENTKLTNGNMYQYSVQFSSWVGFGNETTIGVVDDVVIYRKYRSWNSEMNEIAHWVENSIDTLGVHSDGASLKTIEELYNDCKKILLSKDNGDNHIDLTFEENGIIHNCLFSPKNCADDCSSGVSVDNLVFTNIKNKKP